MNNFNRLAILGALVASLSCGASAQIQAPTPPTQGHPVVVHQATASSGGVKERKDTRQGIVQASPTIDIKNMKQQPAGGPVNYGYGWYPPMSIPAVSPPTK